MSHEYESRLRLYQPEEQPKPSDRYINSGAFAAQLTPEIIDMYADFGLDNVFLPILGKHTSDTHTSIGGNPDTGTRLTTAIPHMDTEENYTTCWQRQLHVPSFTLGRYVFNIDESLKSLGESVPRAISKNSPFINPDGSMAPDITRILAVKMLFAESSVDMVGNSVYMQHRFEKYIPDFNGQSPYYSCELEVPRQFYEQYGQGEPIERDLRADLQALRRGIGLHFLKSDLLRFEVVSKMKYAEWIIRAMQQDDPRKNMNGTPVTPHDEQAISQRILALQPRFGAVKAMIELARSFDSE